MTPLIACVAILATKASAAPRFEVRNDGDAVEITASQVPAEPTAAERGAETFFTETPPVVIAATWTVTELAQRWTNAVRAEDRAALLERLSRTKPQNGPDLRWLVNLFSRGQPEVQARCAASLSRLGPGDTGAGPFLESLLEDEDPVLQSFGLAGIASVRTPAALPLVKGLAEPAFKEPEATLSMSPADSNRWNVHYQALAVLADWQGAATLPLLLRRSKEAPSVAEIAATRFWTAAFDDFAAWSESRGDADQSRAARAWSADVPRAMLAATKDRLWALLLDRRKRIETRHRAAIKAGIVAEPVDVERLLAARARADAQGRLLLDTALFASRSPKAAPILIDYAKNAKDPLARAGTLFQLGEMLPHAEYKELLSWAAQNDPDLENRNNAAAELKGL